MKRSRKYPPACNLEGETTAEELNSMLPAGCRIGGDAHNARWSLSTWNPGSTSRSWNLWGVSGAGWELVRIAWQMAVDESREEESDCPYPDLLKKK